MPLHHYHPWNLHLALVLGEKFVLNLLSYLTVLNN